MNRKEDSPPEVRGSIRLEYLAGVLFLIAAAAVGIWQPSRQTTDQTKGRPEAPWTKVDAPAQSPPASNRDPVGERWQEVVVEVPERHPDEAATYRLVRGRHRLDSMADGRDSRFLASLWAGTYDMGSKQEELVAKRIQEERGRAFAEYADNMKTSMINGQSVGFTTPDALDRHRLPECYIGDLEPNLASWLTEEQWNREEFEKGRRRASEWLAEIGIEETAFFQLDEDQWEKMHGAPLEESLKLLRREQLMMLWWTSPKFVERVHIDKPER